MTAVQPLSSDRLRAICTPESLGFETTEGLPSLTIFIGQGRAIDALTMGLLQGADGYNILVVEPQGSGRTSVLHNFIRETVRRARPEMRAPDVCYLFNFRDQSQPRHLMLPAGQGAQFRQRMMDFGFKLTREIPERLRGKDYSDAVRKLQEEANEKIKQLFRTLEQQYATETYQIRIEPVEGNGVAIAIIEKRNPQQPLNPYQWFLSASDEDDRRARQGIIQKVFKDYAEMARQETKILRDAHREYNRLTTKEIEQLLQHHFAALMRDFRPAQEYFKELRAFILKHADVFSKLEGVTEVYSAEELSNAPANDPLLPFRINVVVDNANTEGVPVIDAAVETFADLFGEIGAEGRGNSLVTDHMKIRGGAILLANQGVLIVDALSVLRQPGAWEKLVSTLKGKEARIGDLASHLGFPSPITLHPEPVPVNLKVVLTCSAWVYHGILKAHALINENLNHLFRARAEFKTETTRTKETERQYAEFLALCAEREGLLPFSAGAAAKIVEHGSRLAGHQQKLSLAMSSIKALALEAHYAAQRGGAARVEAAHVSRAIEDKILRAATARDAIYDRYRDGTVLFDVSEPKVGQIYGLAVYDTGEMRFAVPSRITVQHWAARRGSVVSVDRKAELGGPIFGKAVDIIAAYLQARYAKKEPFTRAVSIVFEQSYGGIEGDSATAAEVLAVLSSLSDIPLRQNIAAITGSMNQMGEMQPIGAANEKIEGYFDVCAATCGVQGHGVIIPAQNVQHLMLREDIVKACARGEFAIYAVHTIGEAAELLTGLPMQEIDTRIEKNVKPEKPKKNHRKNPEEQED